MTERYVRPYVGPESTEHRGVCLYAPNPGESICAVDATRHVLVDSPTYGPVGLASCGDHVAIARATGRVLGEHPFAGVCGLPSTRWSTEGCDLDASGVEPGRG
ncbi:hypothetical protein ACN27G_06065 [Plantactinospora sp. WMMB334]|uniref:hypothetical protein n=1 Tax=Plantactinospora sp. WMMB334 TaxID=3404119 RepID=UPI003B94DADA